jgi:four helix bundle protein
MFGQRMDGELLGAGRLGPASPLTRTSRAAGLKARSGVASSRRSRRHGSCALGRQKPGRAVRRSPKESPCSFVSSITSSRPSAPIHQLCRIIARQDPDLSKQMKRAINSVGLNAGEGLWARGGNRTVRIESAMASGREVILGLRIAGAAGYLDSQRVAREVDNVDRIVATLYKLAYRPA